MLSNINLQQFQEGFQAELTKSAGVGDWLWNHSLGSMGQHGALTNLAGDFMNNAADNAAEKRFGPDLAQRGADGHIDLGHLGQGLAQKHTGDIASGIGSGVANSLGVKWDASKPATDNIANHFNWDKSKGWGDNLKSFAGNNPWTTGIGIAGGLAGGYGIGKSLGLFGGGNSGGGGANTTAESANPQLQHKPNFSGGPSSLAKAGESIPIAEHVNMRVPDMVMPSMLGAPAALGMNLYRMMGAANAGYEEPQQSPSEFNITPSGAKAQHLLERPKARAYITNLMQRSYQ